MANQDNKKPLKLLRAWLATARKPFILRRKDVYHTIAINKSGYLILSMLAKRNNVPRTTMLHQLIRTYAECILNDHAGNVLLG